MAEFDEVLAALASPQGAVATVVAASGSTYRHEGARMLLRPASEAIGGISGGCLEAEVAAAAVEVVSSGRARVLRFDHTGDDEAVWGWGLGCHGAIDVLIEPAADAARFSTLVAAARSQGRTVVLATIIEGAMLGRRMLVHHDGRWEGAVGDGATHAVIRAESGRALRRGRSLTVTSPAGRVFLEVVEPPPQLIVCGAGWDSPPLVEHGARLGWRVVVIDDRRALLDTRRFPSAQRLHVAAPLDAAGAVGPERHTYVVVMTHSFRRDRDYLCSFLSTPIAYLGMLGPRARLDRLLEELQAEGISPSPADLVKLHGPAGLDVGAEGPEEIALAIAAEILAVRAARPGSRLRDRSVKRSIGTYQAGEVSVTGERVGARPLRARPVS